MSDLREAAQQALVQEQDAELSAALGWPGGISNPVLDRVQLLQMVAALRVSAQQALEALEWHYHQGHSNTLGGFRLKIDEKALRNLKAALAREQATMTADDLADSIKRGEKWKVIGCIGHDCEECQTRIAKDALGNFQHQRKGT